MIYVDLIHIFHIFKLLLVVLINNSQRNNPCQLQIYSLKTFNNYIEEDKIYLRNHFNQIYLVNSKQKKIFQF
jgi:hypothetical protein